jgi:hypothetical protein
VEQLSFCIAVDLEGVAVVDMKLSILEVRQLSICVVAGFEVICKRGRFYKGARGLEIVLRITGQESEAVPSQLNATDDVNGFRRHAESRYFERFRFRIEYA